METISRGIRMQHARRLLATSLTLVACVMILPWSPVQAEETLTLQGRVTDREGQPIGDAEIDLTPLHSRLARLTLAEEERAPAARTRSDEGGWFRLQAPSAGMWSVEIRAAGFVGREAILRPLVEPIDLPDVRLSEERALTVTIVGENGSPLAGARVIAHPVRSRFGGGFWSYPQRECTTDSEGRCRLPRATRERINLSVSDVDGRYGEARSVTGSSTRIVVANGNPFPIVGQTVAGRPRPGMTVSVGSWGHPLGRTDADGQFFLSRPGNNDLTITLTDDDGRQVETTVQPADEFERALVLRFNEAANATGRLIASDTRRAVGGGIVWDQMQPSRYTTTDGNGSFSLNCSQGDRLELRAGAPGHLLSNSITVPVGAPGQRSPTLVLEPAAALEGRVATADGVAIVGAELTLREKRTPGSFRIEIGGFDAQPRSKTREDGSFRLSAIDPGRRWEVEVDAAGYAPLTHSLGKLQPRKTLDGVDIEMTPGATVSGRLVDSDGIPLDTGAVSMTRAARGGGGPMMIMQPGDDKKTAEAESDLEGKFELTGIPVGKFDLKASRSGFASRKFPGLEILEAGERIAIGDFVLLPGETLQGRVVDRKGAPVEGATISAGDGGIRVMLGPPGGGDEPEPDATTDVNGWFSVGDLDPHSTPTLTVARSGYISHSSGNQKLPQIDPLEIVLQPASDIGGIIVDAHDEPIVGATVDLTRTRTMQMGGNTMMMQTLMNTTTDSAGRFLFEDEEPGTASVAARFAGFEEAKRDNIEVPQGEDLLDIKLTLQPGAILVGTILTPDGRPAIGAEVRTVGSDEGRRFMPGAPIDGSGNYRLEGLSAGTVSVEATSPDYPRVVRDIQLENGLNQLDMEFRGGQAVRGQVIDESGKPVADARARLATVGSFWGGPEALTDGDGQFEMPGVQSGEYRLFVNANGYAADAGEQTIRVAGQSVDGLRVVLGRGALIEGRVVGVTEDDLARVSVRAEGSGFGGFGGSPVDHEGRFTLENLAPGTFDVVAKLSQSGRQARERVVIEPGQQTAQVELVFGTGLTLSGQALQADQPISDATIYVNSTETQTDGWGPTDADGRFSIDGLEPGSYRVQLQNFRSGLSYSETVEITANREIELLVPSGEIVGRITDGGDRRSLAGVTVSLERPDNEQHTPFSGHGATTDIDGQFRILDIADGNWTLNARKKGYAAQQQQVQVSFGRGPDNLRLTMEPTAGMTLEIRLPNGVPPAQVNVAVMTPSGVALVRDTLATGENGRVRLTTVPPGEWDALVQAGGSATTRIRARSSGATTAVTLQPACVLEVVVPELVTRGAPATMTITDERGRPYQSLGWGANPRSEWTLYSGRTTLRQLPPGSWTVRIRSGETNWQGQTTTRSGAPTSLTLE